MNIARPSPQSIPRRRATRILSSKSASKVTSMLFRSLITVVVLENFDVCHFTSTDSAPFCSVCFNNNYSTSKYQQGKNLACLTWTQNRNFQYWRSQQEGGNEQALHTSKYGQYLRMIGRIETVLRRLSEEGSL